MTTKLDPEKGEQIVLQRLKARGIKIRQHHESWWGTLIGRMAYLFFGEDFPKDDSKHGWVICQTIGSTIWLSNNWYLGRPGLRFEILLHEEKHVDQYERYGLGSLAFGVLVMGGLYLLCLPAVWTMRAKFEKEAYQESMRARFLIGDIPGKGFLSHMQRAFCGRGYFWMDPFPRRVETWYWRALTKAQSESESGVP